MVSLFSFFGLNSIQRLDRPLFSLIGDYYYVRAGNELISMGLASCDTRSSEVQANEACQAGKIRQHLSLLLSAAVMLLLTSVYVV